MSDYDHCDKHKITYLVPEILECPMCYLEQLERRAEGKVTPGLCLNDYDRDMLHETIEHFERQQAELLESRDTKLRSCAYCGNQFDVGSHGGRSDKKYCSDKCRVYANRKEHNDVQST